MLDDCFMEQSILFIALESWWADNGESSKYFSYFVNSRFQNSMKLPAPIIPTSALRFSCQSWISLQKRLVGRSINLFFAAHWRKISHCGCASSCENQVRLFNIKQNFASFKFERLSDKKPLKNHKQRTNFFDVFRHFFLKKNLKRWQKKTEKVRS